MLERSFSKMNENQREAVFAVNGPVVVLAGAGSGKTTAIVNRIVNMINYGDAYTTEEVPNFLDESIIKNMEDVYQAGGNAESVKNIIRHNSVRPWNILAITFTNKAAGELKSRLLSALGESGKDVYASTFHSLCSRILRVHA